MVLSRAMPPVALSRSGEGWDGAAAQRGDRPAPGNGRVLLHARCPLGCGPSTDTLKFAGLRAVVPGQFAQGPAVSRRAYDVEEPLDPMVCLPTFEEAEIIHLFADAEEIQAGLLA